MTEVNVGSNMELKDANQNTNNKDLQVGNSEDGTRDNNTNLQGFLPLFVIAQIVGLLVIMLTFFWSLTYGEGFGFSFPAQFNWHPLLTCLGVIYLSGNAMLSFRLLQNVPKSTVKIVHASLTGVSLLLVLLAVLAAYVFHSNANYPHFYTLHSWMGIMTTALLTVQGSIGFSAYLYPGFSQTLGKVLMPYHVFFGHVTFLLGIVAAISGLNERAIFKLGGTYGRLPASGILINLTGMLIIIFASLVLFLSTNIYYKRRPRREDVAPVAVKNS